MPSPPASATFAPRLNIPGNAFHNPFTRSPRPSSPPLNFKEDSHAVTETEPELETDHISDFNTDDSAIPENVRAYLKSMPQRRRRPGRPFGPANAPSFTPSETPSLNLPKPVRRAPSGRVLHETNYVSTDSNEEDEIFSSSEEEKDPYRFPTPDLEAIPLSAGARVGPVMFSWTDEEDELDTGLIPMEPAPPMNPEWTTIIRHPPARPHTWATSPAEEAAPSSSSPRIPAREKIALVSPSTSRISARDRIAPISTTTSRISNRENIPPVSSSTMSSRTRDRIALLNKPISNSRGFGITDHATSSALIVRPRQPLDIIASPPHANHDSIDLINLPSSISSLPRQTRSASDENASSVGKNGTEVTISMSFGPEDFGTGRVNLNSHVSSNRKVHVTANASMEVDGGHSRLEDGVAASSLTRRLASRMKEVVRAGPSRRGAGNELAATTGTPSTSHASSMRKTRYTVSISVEVEDPKPGSAPSHLSPSSSSTDSDDTTRMPQTPHNELALDPFLPSDSTSANSSADECRPGGLMHRFKTCMGLGTKKASRRGIQAAGGDPH